MPYRMSGETLMVGSIGSTSPQLSQYILDSSEILEDVLLRLQGKVKLMQEDGSYKVVDVAECQYNPRCFAWTKGKLQEVLNKNMYLSQLDEIEMYKEARCISMGFITELYYNSKSFEIGVEQFTELVQLHRNFLSQAIRRPLGESDKRFLKETTSESTQRVQQSLTEQREKKGLFGLFK